MAKATPLALDFAEAIGNKFGKDVSVLAGQKFDKVVIASVNGSRSVHAFIERSTGKLIKAAGWNAPQKDKGGLAVRYELDEPESFAHAVEVADPYGSYLYAH